MAERGSLLQYLGSDLLGAVFHCTTADGTADTAFLADQHTCTGTSGGSAGGGDNGNQYQRLAVLQFIFDGFQHIPHLFFLL